MKKMAEGGAAEEKKGVLKRKLKYAMDKGMGWQSLFAIDDIADPTRNNPEALSGGGKKKPPKEPPPSDPPPEDPPPAPQAARPASNSWPDIVKFYFPDGAGKYYKDGGLVRGGGSAQRGRGRGRIV